MKRLIAAGIVFVIAVVMTICSSVVIQSTAKNVIEKIDVIQQNAKNKTSFGNEKEFEKYWEGKEALLSVFVNHEDLSEIGLASARMTSAATAQQYGDVLEAADEIHFIINNITEDEQFHWFSFF